MTSFTSTLPDHLLQLLSEKAAAYIKSYKEASSDKEIMAIAEEGMEDYLAQVREE